MTNPVVDAVALKPCPQRTFIAAARDFHDAGPDGFQPGWAQYGDLLDAAEALIAEADARQSADAALVAALEATLDGLRRASRILSEDCKSVLNGKQWGGLLIDNAERALSLTRGERT